MYESNHNSISLGPSPCSSPPPLGGNCPVPWIQPQQGFSFNPMSGNCQPGTNFSEQNICFRDHS